MAGLDQSGAEAFKQHQFGTAGVEWVNYLWIMLYCSGLWMHRPIVWSRTATILIVIRLTMRISQVRVCGRWHCASAKMSSSS